MVSIVKNQNKSYEITCSDWSIILKASNANEAACLALKTMINERGKNLNLSFILEVKEYNIPESVEFLYVPSVLFDIGYFKLSKDFSTLSDFVLDKAKNPH